MFYKIVKPSLLIQVKGSRPKKFRSFFRSHPSLRKNQFNSRAHPRLLSVNTLLGSYSLTVYR